MSNKAPRMQVPQKPTRVGHDDLPHVEAPPRTKDEKLQASRVAGKSMSGKVCRRQLGTKDKRVSAPAAPAGLDEDDDGPIQFAVRARPKSWICPATGALFLTCNMHIVHASPAEVEAADEASEPQSVYASDAA